ncbi:MAG: tetratricopeptide repeat protein [Panacagrimonas sp.]
MSHSMKLSKQVLIFLLAWVPGLLFALDLKYEPPEFPSPQQRRLMADKFRPAGAPTSLQVEAAKVQDGAQDALRFAALALKRSEAAYGAESTKTVVPRINLAYAKLWAGQNSEALRAFRKSIELAGRTSDPRNPLLFEAWYGLGAVQFAAGLPDGAAESFAMALQYHRTRNGLYSQGQLEVLHALALAETRHRKFKEAQRWQMRRLEVAERVQPADSPERARTYISVGRWFRDAGQNAEAVRLHKRAVAIKEKIHGPASPELIGALLDLALSMGNQERAGFRGDRGSGNLQDSALGRAFRIADTNRNASADERARLLHLIGDTNWLVGRRGPATDAYRRAAALQPRRAVQEAKLAVPTFLSFAVPKPGELAADGSALVAEFAVDRLGRARDIRIVESTRGKNVDELRSRLVRALQGAKLRPRMEHGKPVKTANVRYRLVASNAADG